MAESANDLNKVWADQADFNAQVRQRPTVDHTKAAVTTELVTGLISEAVELLRTTKWKKHRRERRYTSNLAHTTEEIVDIFKYVVSLCDVWGVTPEQLIEGYWAKSAVVRQRYSEEWVHHHIAGPVILLDLDNVLCDYTQGFGEYLLHDIARSRTLGDKYFNRMADRIGARQWIDASLFDVDDRPWFESLKHAFRCSGAKRDLPVMPGARDFVKWCHDRAMVILLTARPIDRYPNTLTDTVGWLNKNNIRVDHIWWGADKGKVVQLEEIQEHVLFAVDDVLAHCQEYDAAGVKSYLIGPPPPDPNMFYGWRELYPRITDVRSFTDIMQREDTIARIQR